MHRSQRRLVAVVLLGVIAAGAAALVTGRIAYQVTSGVSMEPTYRDGDLVVVMPTRTYHSGDVVAYHGGHDGDLLVLHRIVGGDRNGFVLKGDNNQSTDPTQPAAGQIVGRTVLHVAKVGAVLTSPITRALLGLAALGLLAGLIVNPHPRPERTKRRSGGSRRAGRARTALVALDVALLIAVALLYVWPSAPAAAATVPPTQTSSFTYGADVPISATYPTGRLTTGDTVFTKLLTTISVIFRYSTDATPGSVRGTVRLDAALSTPGGWHAELPLVPPRPLTAGTMEVTSMLDLARIQTLAATVAQETGVGSAPVAVTVRASWTVSLDGAEQVTSTSELPFQLTALQLSLTNVKPTSSPTGPVVTTTVPFAVTPRVSDSPTDVRHQAMLGLVASLVLGIGGAIVVWPPQNTAGRALPTVWSTPTSPTVLSTDSPAHAQE